VAPASPDPRPYTMDGQAIEPAVQYVQKIKQRCDPDTYRQFLDILSRFHYTPDLTDEVFYFRLHLVPQSAYHSARRKSQDRLRGCSRMHPICALTLGFSCLTEVNSSRRTLRRLRGLRKEIGGNWTLWPIPPLRYLRSANAKQPKRKKRGKRNRH
jgi:hypothetical protein